MGDKGPRGPIGNIDDKRKALLEHAFYIINCMDDDEIECLIDVLKLYATR